jgi:GT2 family glycosyltransferase
MKVNGWKISPIPGTVIFHHQGQSSKQDIEKVIFLRFKNEFIFVKKFYPLNRVVLFRLLQFIGAGLRFGFWVLKYLFNPEDWETKQKIKGYLRVLLAPWDYKKVRALSYAHRN